MDQGRQMVFPAAIPFGRQQHSGLKTNFVIFDKFLNEMEDCRLTGYISLQDWESSGFLFFENGILTQAHQSSPQGSYTGLAAHEKLRQRFTQPDGVIAVHALDPDILLFLSLAPFAELKSEGKLTDRDQLTAILKWFEFERQGGFVDLVIEEAGFRSSIFIEIGAPSFLSVDSAKFADDSDLSQLDAVLAEYFRHGGGIVRVFQLDLEKELSKFVTLKTQIRQKILRPILGKLAEQIAEAWKSASEPRDFFTAFRQSCVELSDQYIFLDPFVGDIVISQDQLQFSGDVSSPEYIQGVFAVLARTLQSHRKSSHVVRKFLTISGNETDNLDAIFAENEFGNDWQAFQSRLEEAI